MKLFKIILITFCAVIFGVELVGGFLARNRLLAECRARGFEAGAGGVGISLLANRVYLTNLALSQSLPDADVSLRVRRLAVAGLDRFALRDGAVAFRKATLAGGAAVGIVRRAGFLAPFAVTANDLAGTLVEFRNRPPGSLGKLTLGGRIALRAPPDAAESAGDTTLSVKGNIRQIEPVPEGSMTIATGDVNAAAANFILAPVGFRFKTGSAAVELAVKIARERYAPGSKITLRLANLSTENAAPTANLPPETAKGLATLRDFLPGMQGALSLPLKGPWNAPEIDFGIFEKFTKFLYK
ncbi:MAG: hypothetical protein V1809_12735 [Planctomycetota bacterium]